MVILFPQMKLTKLDKGLERKEDDKEGLEAVASYR